ncbi:hypothetical protein HPB50_013682 [Hyalomma asiaticum]|uniref:Uncharacterized protein n=1 Tax=Hyalomma asiaticum TaxID=266040 RepID=A0ACB7TJZ8_HYAAI|nr:hypothetical protein HPB50_013682 [Hyalomma asiaticum]
MATTDNVPDSSEVVPGRPVAQHGRPFFFLLACFDVGFRVFAEKVSPGVVVFGARGYQGFGVGPAVVRGCFFEASKKLQASASSMIRPLREVS